MTQEELGKRLNLSAQAISKWENGDSLPDLSLIADLAAIFDCTTDYLLGRRLNDKADLVMRLLAIIHQTVRKMGTLNITMGLRRKYLLR